MNDRNDINEKLSHGNIANLLRKMAIPGVISQILLLLFILPMFITNKMLAVVLSAPISDVLSVAVTLVCFVPGFYRNMRSPDHFNGEKINLPAEN